MKQRAAEKSAHCAAARLFRAPEDGLRTVTVHFENMHCGSSIGQVTQALLRAGAEVQEVRLGAARLRLPDTIQDQALIDSLRRVGYRAIVERDGEPQAQ